MNKPQDVQATVGDLPPLSDDSRSPNPQKIDFSSEDIYIYIYIYILFLLIKISSVCIKGDLLGKKKMQIHLLKRCVYRQT